MYADITKKHKSQTPMLFFYDRQIYTVFLKAWRSYGKREITAHELWNPLDTDSSLVMLTHYTLK